MSVIDTSDPTCGTVTCLCTGRVLHCCLHSCSWGLTSWHRVRAASLQLVTGTSSAVVVHLVRGATSHLATGLCTCAHHLTLNTAPAPAPAPARGDMTPGAPPGTPPAASPPPPSHTHWSGASEHTEFTEGMVYFHQQFMSGLPCICLHYHTFFLGHSRFCI